MTRFSPRLISPLSAYSKRSDCWGEGESPPGSPQRPGSSRRGDDFRTSSAVCCGGTTTMWALGMLLEIITAEYVQSGGSWAVGLGVSHEGSVLLCGVFNVISSGQLFDWKKSRDGRLPGVPAQAWSSSASPEMMMSRLRSNVGAVRGTRSFKQKNCGCGKRVLVGVSTP